MTRADLEQRLIDLERAIEGHRTAIWLADHERLTLLNELRWLLQAETKAATP